VPDYGFDRWSSISDRGRGYCLSDLVQTGPRTLPVSRPGVTEGNSSGVNRPSIMLTTHSVYFRRLERVQF
jgi:hypothetical protein